MAKNPNRVKAGKKAWAKRSAASKQKSLRALGAKSKRKGYSMAKNNSRNSKQGFGSWLGSVIAWTVALSNIAFRGWEALNRPASESKWKYFGQAMLYDHLGVKLDDSGRYVDFDKGRLVRGWGPFAGGIAVKKGLSYLGKTAPIKSLIPRLHLG